MGKKKKKQAMRGGEPVLAERERGGRGDAFCSASAKEAGGRRKAAGEGKDGKEEE